ncbi:DEBR0S1_34486g1_1 [Brettanomyces bruxellensis]|uniref:DEBR0S1_34486g1_1 n=1 Tax=Dekkera bruxellensis TaxID=5007 RepID=A0A7D9CWI5_DEKBR|nr:DEBR0S1_34486g1_1 [Brettanomyces bruxellensis]
MDKQNIKVTMKQESDGLEKSAIVRLLSHDHEHNLQYLGPFSLGSITSAIKKLLSTSSPLETISETSRADFYGPMKIPRALNITFLKSFMTLAHEKYFLLEPYMLVETLKKNPSTRKNWEGFCLEMALGIGCRLVWLTRVKTYPQPQYYFNNAMQYLSKAEMKPLREIQACALIGAFVERCFTENSHFYMSSWELIGMALRKLIQYGYHKKRQLSLNTAIEYEGTKRIFWSIYCFEKALSLSLGRPSSINDDFIDIPLPISFKMSDNPTEIQIRCLFEKQKMQQNNDKFDQPVTEITILIKTTLMSKIRAKMQEILSSVDCGTSKNELFKQISDTLEKWHRELPSKQVFNNALEEKKSYESLEVLYYEAKLSLLLPMLMMRRSEESLLLNDVCSAASGICGCYMKMYHESDLIFSVHALRTTFLAGMTILYFVKMFGHKKLKNVHISLRTCSSLLILFTERWPSFKIYQNLFDSLWDFIELEKQTEDTTRDSKNTVKLLNNRSIKNIDEVVDPYANFRAHFNKNFWIMVLSHTC